MIQPIHIGYLVRKPGAGVSGQMPRWLQTLQPVFSGISTVDNMDFIQGKPT